MGKVELAAISKLRAWREKQVAEIKQREEELANQLRAAAPKSFAKYFREEVFLIPNLLEYGVASRKYRRSEDDGAAYGYTDLDEFERRFGGLKAAWAGVVAISISWDERYRFEVEFTVV